MQNVIFAIDNKDQPFYNTKKDETQPNREPSRPKGGTIS